MSLSRLEILDFRNLADVKIDLCHQFNLFYGENGSGKTSLLEAIYHLGFGRSFRTHRLNHLIRKGCEKFSLFGNVSSVPIGIERCRKGSFCIHLQKKEVHSAAELANVLPLQLINHTIYHLIDSGPKIRRQFIDWGVFHVEHFVFLSLWKKISRLLKQRNAALKIRPVSKKQVMLWQSDFVETAQLIDCLRRQYLERFEPILLQVLQQLLPLDKLNLVFYSGWDDKRSLEEVLNESLDADLERKYTFFGPHHADLRIYVDKAPIYDVLSRGQLKLFTCAMRLAQAILLKEQKQKPCVFLVDDLASELDDAHMKKVCGFLSGLDSQVFLTGTRFGFFDELFRENLCKTFSVKRGIINEVS